MPISHCQPCVMTPEATWSWFPLWLSIMIIHLYSYFFIGKLTFSTMINHGHPVSCLVTELSNVALGFAAGAWTKHHWKAKKGVEAGQSCKINIDKTYHTIIPYPCVTCVWKHDNWWLSVDDPVFWTLQSRNAEVQGIEALGILLSRWGLGYLSKIQCKSQ